MKSKIFTAIFIGLFLIALPTSSYSADTKIVIRQPKSTTVSLGNSIQTAINSAAEGDTIVLATGTYNETISIEKGGLTIQGSGSGSTIIDGGGGSLPVILINGAKNVTVKSLTVQNGNDGINARNGASFTIENLIIKNNSDDGLDIQNNCIASVLGNSNIVDSNQGDGATVTINSSLLQVQNSTFVSKNNGGRGVFLGGSAFLSIPEGCAMTLQNNQNAAGLQISNSSTAGIRGTLLVDANAHRGIILTLSSGLWSEGSITVQGTTGAGLGIFIQQASAFYVYRGDLTVQNNSGTYGDGIMVARDSNLDLRGSSLNIVITNNGKNGISAYQASSIRLDAGVKVNSNGTNGIAILQQSVLYASSVEVKYNSGWGITGDDGSSVDCNNSIITNNSSGAVSLSFGARSTLNGNTISPTPISCDSSALSRGSHVCP